MTWAPMGLIAAEEKRTLVVKTRAERILWAVKLEPVYWNVEMSVMNGVNAALQARLEVMVMMTKAILIDDLGYCVELRERSVVSYIFASGFPHWPGCSDKYFLCTVHTSSICVH